MQPKRDCGWHHCTIAASSATRSRHSTGPTKGPNHPDNHLPIQHGGAQLVDIDRSSGVKWQQVQTPPFEITVSKDASLLGLGATWQGTTIRGRLAARGGTISHKPTRAKGSLLSTLGSLHVTHPVSSTCSSTNGQHVHNSSSVCQQDGRHSISQSVITSHRSVGNGFGGQILSNSRTHSWHIQRRDRHASRQFDGHLEWTLHEDIFRRSTHRFYRSSVDLFASRINNQLSQYVSRYPDPGALMTDAFLCNWSQWRSWIYPPVVLIPRILNKILTDQATVLILAPHWKEQSWFPSLLEMLVDYPRQLPQQPGVIMLPFEPETEHPLQHKLHLTVWPVSGNASIQEDFHQRLRKYCCHRGAKRPKNENLSNLVYCTVSLSPYCPCEFRSVLPG